MDIRVGSTPALGSPSDKTAAPEGSVEARVLAVRRPRRAGGGPPTAGERRTRGGQRDPLTGRVLILMIPDGSRLPDGLESGNYRVFLRFARR